MKLTSTKSVGNDSLKIVVHAPAGNGKTTLAKTTGAQTLIVSAEAGLLSLKGTDIAVIDVTKKDDDTLVPLAERFGALRVVYAELLKEKPYGLEKLEWVFIDSLTEFSQLLMAEMRVKHPDPKDSIKMYGENFNMMTDMLKAFRDLPRYNVVFTALSTVDKDESGARHTTLDLIGKASSAVPGYFDEVFYLGVNPLNGERKLLTNTLNNIVAKDRSGKLSQMEEPDLAMIAKKIRG